MEFDNIKTACEILATQTGLRIDAIRLWVGTFNIDIINNACYLAQHPLDVIQDVINNELNRVFPYLKY